MIFRPNSFLRLSRYAFLLTFIGLPLYLSMLAFDTSLIKEVDRVSYLSFCLLLAASGIALLHKFFWEKFFAILEITENRVAWKCFFRKTIELPIGECEYIGVQKEESHNGIPYYFIYISKMPYPVEYFGKINKMPCKKGFIKYWYSAELSDYLVSIMPRAKTGNLSAFKIQSKRR